MAAFVLCMINEIKVKFCMPEFSCRNVVSHQFKIYNNECEVGIGYGMIMGRDIMSRLILLANFKWNTLERSGTVVLMKDTGLSTVKYNFAKIKMREVVIHTTETEYNECVINILKGKYKKSYLKEVNTSTTYTKIEERILILSLLK